MHRHVAPPFVVLAALAGLLSVALVAVDACKNTVGPGGEGEVFEGEGDGGGEGEGEGGPNCASGPVFGIQVKVEDPCTQFFVCGATATANDGTTTETLAPTGSSTDNSCAYQGALDKAGTYTVTVDAPQYNEKTFSDVEVTLDPCGHAVLNKVSGELLPTDGCAQ